MTFQVILIYLELLVIGT